MLAAGCRLPAAGLHPPDPSMIQASKLFGNDVRVQTAKGSFFIYCSFLASSSLALYRTQLRSQTDGRTERFYGRTDRRFPQSNESIASIGPRRWPWTRSTAESVCPSVRKNALSVRPFEISTVSETTPAYVSLLHVRLSPS